MENRYLFRAKRIDNREWIIGNLICSPDGRNAISETGGDWMLQEVDSSTICQCTGLKDKNGKLIWENDICDRKEPYPEIVTSTKGDWTLDYSYATRRERGSCYCNLGFYTNERMSVSVIGNIFDNPELLEQEG